MEQSRQDGSAIPPVDAASIVLARRPFDIYMTLRPPRLSFAGGFYVFPGGAVEPADGDVPVPELPAGFSEELGGAAVIAAAVRETFEEVGILLGCDEEGRPLWIDARDGGGADGETLQEARRRLLHGETDFARLLEENNWRIAADRLRYIGRWVTPPAFRRRYDTRFFLADVSGGIEPDPYEGEIERAAWMPLPIIMEQAVDPLPPGQKRGPRAVQPQGDLPLMPPTYGTLRALAWHRDVEEAMAFFADRARPRVLVARLQELNPVPAGTVPYALFSGDGSLSLLDVALASLGVHRIPITSPTLAPWAETSAYLLADGGEGLLVDAGAGGKDGARRVRDVWEQVGRPTLKALVLTHAHPDHCLGAPDIMEELGPLPVWAHPLEKERLARYVPSLSIQRPLHDGDKLQVGAMKLTVLHTPGHAEGHLCFWWERYGVLLAGDMVIHDASVWVGPPDGDLITFLDQIRRLAALPIQVAAPSHGAVFAGVKDHLEGLIQRRLKREEEILALLSQGPATVDDVVDALYEGKVPDSVLWVARRTVEGHLQKLVREGRVALADGDDARYRACGPATP